MDYFTSDTHFNHANIISYCKRPFANVAVMNKALIDNWNAVVTPDDTVWHLGDFALGNQEDVPEIFRHLNGTKHLVQGNHDPNKVKNLPWAHVHQHFVYPHQEMGRFKIWLFHNPKAAKKSIAPAIVLHGHMHGQSDLHPFDKHPHIRYLDVGVDCWNYRPISMAQIMDRINNEESK